MFFKTELKVCLYNKLYPVDCGVINLVVCRRKYYISTTPIRILVTKANGIRITGLVILIVIVISFGYQEYFFVHDQFYKSDISMSEKFFGVLLVHYQF